MIRYMVIERFHRNALNKVYKRFHEQGWMLPEGLYYLDSWLEKSGERCFQLMETDDPSLFDDWLDHWNDLTGFEVVEIGAKPVLTDVGS